ncbi:hypothetical protein IAU59_002842 [Kwoniella sp. CBS 9459]
MQVPLADHIRVGDVAGEPSTKRQRLGNNTNGQQAGSSSKVRYRMAYLGPQGTYGEMAARAFRSRYDPEIDFELVPCPSIPEIWSTEADYHVMPIENRIHGAVTETLDSLLSVLSPRTESISSSSGSDGPQTKRPQRCIRMDLALPIRHCLVVRKGTKVKDIQWVRSHEQALGQSSVFLSQNLPHAVRQKWPSTAGAAVSLVSPSPADVIAGPGAAICSKGVVRLHPELEILYEGTQSIEDNHTRFLLIESAASPEGRSGVPIPHPEPILATPNPSPADFYAISSPSEISNIVSTRTISTIHSRPAPSDFSSRNAKTNGSADNHTSSHFANKFPTLYLVETIPKGTGSHSDANALRDLAKTETETDNDDQWTYLGRTEYTVTQEQLDAL